MRLRERQAGRRAVGRSRNSSSVSLHRSGEEPLPGWWAQGGGGLNASLPQDRLLERLDERTRPTRFNSAAAAARATRCRSEKKQTYTRKRTIDAHSVKV